MNAIFILTIVVGLLSLSDFIKSDKNMSVHQLIYHIAFLFFYFFVSIKYYFGPDIAVYIPIYENIEDPLTFLTRGSIYSNNFEYGYLFFCSIIKFVGFSFWWMTFIVSTLYFYAIYKLFKRLNGYKTFALLLLVYFESGLYLYELRQSLAISFFILAFLSYIDKNYIRSLLFVIVCILMHKSAVLICTLSAVFLIFNKQNFNKKIFWILSLLLVVLVFVSFKSTLLLITKHLPISELAKDSIQHHFLLTENIQLIAPLYFLTLYSLYYYGTPKHISKQWNDLMLLLSFIIVFLYQDFFLLIRVRSYFIPIAIVYFVNAFSIKHEDKKAIYKQGLVVYAYLICLVVSFSSFFNERKKINKVNDYTTIFQLFIKSEDQIRRENTDKANYFWKNEYMKDKDYKKHMSK